jgi:hypothetical protein
MESMVLIKIAVRTLTALDAARQPDASDIQVLRSEAQPDERYWELDELAREIIKREIAKRRISRR